LHLQGAAEGNEQASRGKVVLLKKKVEELEQQLKQVDAELQDKVPYFLMQVEALYTLLILYYILHYRSCKTTAAVLHYNYFVLSSATKP